MCNIFNLLNLIDNSDFVFYALIIALIILIIVMIYLIFTQNKGSNMIVPQNKDKETEKTSEVPDLVEVVESEIPDKLEYTQALWQNDLFELQGITRELEQAPKKQNINMTSYEAEQEEKAIISYDELINKSLERQKYSEEQNKINNDVRIKKVDLDDDEILSKINTGDYEHEEAFLDSLKNLQKILN